MEYILPPKQKWRPLPFLLSLSFFYTPKTTCHCVSYTWRWGGLTSARAYCPWQKARLKRPHFSFIVRLDPLPLPPPHTCRDSKGDRDYRGGKHHTDYRRNVTTLSQYQFPGIKFFEILYWNIRDTTHKMKDIKVSDHELIFCHVFNILWRLTFCVVSQNFMRFYFGGGRFCIECRNILRN